MAFVRVFNNVYLNPACVGKAILDVEFTDNKRTYTTTVFDATGKEILLFAETSAQTPVLDSDPNALDRQRHLHKEIVDALHYGRDALDFSE